jgi:hypothetical protein
MCPAHSYQTLVITNFQDQVHKPFNEVFSITMKATEARKTASNESARLPTHVKRRADFCGFDFLWGGAWGPMILQSMQCRSDPDSPFYY